MTIPFAALFYDGETIAVQPTHEDEFGLREAGLIDLPGGRSAYPRRARCIDVDSDGETPAIRYQQCGGGRRVLRKAIGGN